jgi:endonuclease-3
VNKVTDLLFKKYTSLDDYLHVSLEQFDQDIKSINYHTTKAKNILQTARIIQDKHAGIIPDTFDELLELPGVGRKTANVILGNLHKKPVGIAVDTHVRRLSKLYGLTNEIIPDKIEKDLMAIVPKADWTDFTHLMIEYGRNYCPARKHKHEECKLQEFLGKQSQES